MHASKPRKATRRSPVVIRAYERKLVGNATSPAPILAARRAASSPIFLAGFTGSVAQGRRAPPPADDPVTLHAIAGGPRPGNRSLRACALAVDHHAATLTLPACSVKQLSSGRTLAVWRSADHAAGAFRALFARLGSGIPVLPSRTEAVGRRAGRTCRAGIVAGLIYENLTRRARPLAVRRRTNGPWRTIGRPASSLAEGGAFCAAVGRRAAWAVRGTEPFLGLAAGAVFVRLVEHDIARRAGYFALALVACRLRLVVTVIVASAINIVILLVFSVLLRSAARPAE